jgi:hypothetical protein
MVADVDFVGTKEFEKRFYVRLQEAGIAGWTAV